MIKKFQENLSNHHLLDSSKTVLLAVSGGVDSIVLLDLISKIPRNERPQVSIAHLNHQLRNESDEEERFVEKLAEKYNVKLYIQHWDKKNHVATGIELAAREKRYRFFKEVMTNHQISYLMTGHHLDDQVETILMRLTRGASLEQLLGIHRLQTMLTGEQSTYLIRPLLDFSKEEIYAYAEKNQLSYMEDASNQQLDYTRNRFRNEIIPLLKEENDRFNEHIKQFTFDLADILELAQGPIEETYIELVEETDDEFHLGIDKYIRCSNAMQRAILKKILENLYDGKKDQYKTNYIQLINEWLHTGEVNSSLDLKAGYIVEKTYEKLIFKKKKIDSHLINQEAEFKLDRMNEWIELSETEKIGLFAKATPLKLGKYQEVDELLIQNDLLHLPLTIRHRASGDRMSYAGLQGTKKIKDIFIDDKTSKEDREKAWLVEDNHQKIIWLISHRKMSLFTEEETDKILYSLKYIKK